MLLALEHNKPMLAFGEPGTGKTLFAEVVAAMTNRPYKRISGMEGLEVADVVGNNGVVSDEKGMSTVWEDGDIAHAVRNGYLLADDEPFKNNAGINMAKMWLYETRDPKLKLVGNHGEREITPHETFRIIMCDNVRGTGDNADMMAATNLQDAAFLNRIVYKIHTPYLKSEEETSMLVNKFPEMKKPFAAKMVRLGNAIRDAYKSGTVELPWTVRQLEEWAEATVYFRDPVRAFDLCYYSGLNDEEKGVVNRLWTDVGFYDHKLK